MASDVDEVLIQADASATSRDVRPGNRGRQSASLETEIQQQQPARPTEETRPMGPGDLRTRLGRIKRTADQTFLAPLDPQTRQVVLEADKKYKYCALSGDEIRLFQIEPSDCENDQIRASLIHMRLHSAQAMGYTALSYTWGEATATEVVMVDGKPLAIKPKLLAILQRLRSLAYKLVWVSTYSMLLATTGPQQGESTRCFASVSTTT
jgi:hypothetical protein